MASIEAILVDCAADEIQVPFRAVRRRKFFDHSLLGRPFLAGTLWLWIGLLAVGLPACQRLSGNGDLRQSPGSVTGGDGGPQVIFYPSAGGPPVRVRVELARTPAEQERGLMFRRSLDADAGMLFLFDRLEIRRFWMRNCYIPLDMIFLDEQKVVVGIEENTLPLDESSRGPDRPAQYVIEVEGGYARRHGFGPGTRVEFRNVN